MNFYLIHYSIEYCLNKVGLSNDELEFPMGYTEIFAEQKEFNIFTILQ